MQTARGASLSDAEPQNPASGVETRPRRLGLFAAVAATGYALDQVTKWIAERELTGRDPVPVVDGLLQLRLVYNSGAAFGLAAGATALLTVVAAVVVVVVLRLATQLRSRGWALALGLLLAGSLGNLTDRLLRDPEPLRGHVVDFLELPHWPVFNVADMAIVSAAGLVVALTMRGRRMDGSRDGA